MGSGKRALCRSATAGKAIGVCKTTGGKATGRCREGFEGAKRQSWKRKKRLCADPRQLAKPWEKKAVTDLRQLEKPLAFARNRSKGHLTLHVGNRKNELCADLRQLEKPLAFARNRSKGHLTLQAKVWALEPEKRALCRSPPTRETIGICHRTLQGGPGGGLARRQSWKRKKSPDSWKSHGH